MKPLSELKHLLPENPPGMAEGHYQTMNNMGSCEDFLDELTQAFVDYSKDKKVIDIGCGYGTHAILAYENGAKKVIAADIELSNLKILEERIEEGLLDISTLRLAIDDNDFLADNIFDAALLNKVLHLLNHKEHIKGLINIYDMLKSGGKLFIKCISPFSIAFSKEFKDSIEKYDNITNQSIPANMPEIFKEKLPHMISIFTTKSLSRLLKSIGFEVEVCKYIDAKTESMRGGYGKDYVMAIARKI